MVVLAALTFAISGWAQYRAPQQHKGPRAVAVLEVGAHGGARLIPVSLWYEGKYYDATFYQSNPVPLALYSDTLYEALNAGTPVGRFTVNGARQMGAAWWGEGFWKPTVLSAEKKPVLHTQSTATFSDTGKPILQTPQTAAKPTATTASSTGQQTGDTSGGELHVKIDPKTGRVSDTTVDKSPTDKEAKKDTPPPDTDDPDRPHLHRPATEPAAESVGSNEQVEEDDPNRPRLTRGGAADKNKAEESDKIIGPRTYMVAVSDPNPMEHRPLGYEWTDAEKEKLTADARKVAIAALRKAAPLRHFTLPAKGDIALTDVATRAYDLDYSNSPEVVFTATYTPASAPVAPSAKKQPVKTGVWVEGNAAEKAAMATEAAASAAPALQRSYSVTVVLRESADGVMNTIFAEVSDPLDLETFPALRLVDAVDADGDGRADFVFRNIRPEGTSFVIYKVSPYDMTKVFDTPPRRY